VIVSMRHHAWYNLSLSLTFLGPHTTVTIRLLTFPETSQSSFVDYQKQKNKNKVPFLPLPLLGSLSLCLFIYLIIYLFIYLLIFIAVLGFEFRAFTFFF
jgi:hypothetical protein